MAEVDRRLSQINDPTVMPRTAEPSGAEVPARTPSPRGSSAGAPVDPYAAFTELVEDYEYHTPDLVGVLSPFAAGLLALTGRLLAVLAHRDAFVLGDGPLNRRSAKAKATVFAHLPVACDRQDRAWRLAWARCLDDLADDLEAGRAPLPRCTGERWALGVMADRAPHLLARSDACLAELGIPLPEENGYRPPYWDGVVEAFVVDDAPFSIAEALASGANEEAEPPAGGWDEPRFWFSPYGITEARPAGRGHPPWVAARLAGTPSQPEGGFDRAADLLGYTNRADPWAAFADGHRGLVIHRVLAEVLTPQAADLLIVAAHDLAEIGYAELVALGDEHLIREPDDDGGWYTDGVFLANLPPMCDGQNQAWRLAMVRTLDDLAEDLRHALAPLPRCTAEEVALHLILSDAQRLLEDSNDADLALLGLPARSAWSARHREFDLMREVFFQDEDVLMAYDVVLADVGTDPDHAVNQWLHTGDLRPPAWFWTFANLRPRPAGRGFRPAVLAALRRSSPALRFTTPVQQPGGDDAAVTPTPDRLAEHFERLVGLAQRRFFDRPCAVAMAGTLHDLLVAFLDSPQLNPARVWMLGRHTTVGHEMLLVDEQFSIDGQTTVWRLNADRTDGDARAWTLAMLTDCAAKVVTAYTIRSPALLLDLHDLPTPHVDPALPQALSGRAAALSDRTTVGGFMTHRRHDLGLSLTQLADAAVLPAPVIASWESGADAAPTQLLRCAPALQTPEAVLLRARDGLRDTGYWPLPAPAAHTRP